MKYSEAGVSIDAQNESNERIKKHVETTYTKEVVTGVGHFAGSVRLGAIKEYQDPVLVMSTDGVGTKTMIAEKIGMFESLGEDIVHNCANDVLAIGATPKYFTDYIASSRLRPEITEQIVKGIAHACKRLQIILMGGETAEMPGVYNDDRHDLVGTMVGIAERNELYNPTTIKEGDVLIALPSSGFHTNGYSLIRKIISSQRLDLDKQYDLPRTLGKELMLPHREYVTAIHSLRSQVNVLGLAHITGGGLTENIPRFLPEGLGASISMKSWTIPAVFRFVQQQGSVSRDELLRTFNCGIGMIMCIREMDKEKVFAQVPEAFDIGTVIIGKGVTYTNY